MANADFQHWARKDYWLWHECVALVHGVEPPAEERLPHHCLAPKFWAIPD